MRMSTPCRPTTCDHLQCFDASLFLMMNEKKPTWICPVCDSTAKYDDIMVDGYFEEVIKSAELPEKEAEEKKNAVVLDLSDDDEDYTPAPKPAADPEAAPPAEDLPVLPPPPPAEIECIDIE